MTSCTLSSTFSVSQVAKAGNVERKVQLRTGISASKLAVNSKFGFKQSTYAQRRLIVKAKKNKGDDDTVKMEPTIPEAEELKVPSDTVVVPPDYRLGGILLGVSFILGPVLHDWFHFLIHAFLGGFLTVQASRVRFRVTDSDLEVVFVDPFSEDVEEAKELGVDSSGENYLQGGGENKWALSSITNWEFWWPGFPVLVFYKESQTKADGQVHFFPILSNGKMLYETMLARFPASKNPKPSPDDWNLLTALESTSLGRTIIEQVDDDQKESLKKTKGLPGIDK